jgi:phage-related minor tail protein
MTQVEELLIEIRGDVQGLQRSLNDAKKEVLQIIWKLEGEK